MIFGMAASSPVQTMRMRLARKRRRLREAFAWGPSSARFLLLGGISVVAAGVPLIVLSGTGALQILGSTLVTAGVACGLASASLHFSARTQQRLPARSLILPLSARSSHLPSQCELLGELGARRGRLRGRLCRECPLRRYGSVRHQICRGIPGRRPLRSGKALRRRDRAAGNGGAPNRFRRGLGSGPRPLRGDRHRGDELLRRNRSSEHAVSARLRSGNARNRPAARVERERGSRGSGGLGRQARASEGVARLRRRPQPAEGGQSSGYEVVRAAGPGLVRRALSRRATPQST